MSTATGEMTRERIAQQRDEVVADRRAAPGLRLLLGAVAGVFSGSLFIGLNMWFATGQGNPPEAPFRLISTLVLGGDALQAGQASVWLGVLIHFGISAAAGLVFALAVPFLRAKDSLHSAGALYGGLLYWVNFTLLGTTVFPQFQQPNQPLEFGLHVLFGLVLAGSLVLPHPSPGLTGHALTRGQLPARVVGALTAGGVALIHLALAGHHLQREYYVGALFILGSATLVYVGMQLVRGNDALAWTLGTATMVIMFASLILSRTTGLPSDYLRPGFSGMAISTLVLEAVFVVAAWIALRGRRGAVKAR